MNDEKEQQDDVKQGEVVGQDGYDANDKENNKIMALLCYLSFIVLGPYFTEKNSKWVRHHAIQGMNLLILEAIGLVLSIIPIIGGLASTIIWLYTLLVSVMGIINVCNCEDKELPLLNRFNFIKK